MVVSAGAVSFITLEANGSSNCRRWGRRTHTHTHIYRNTQRAIRGWGDGAGGHAGPQGRSCFVVMFFLLAEAPLSACVSDTQINHQGRASDDFLSFPFDVSFFSSHCTL